MPEKLITELTPAEALALGKFDARPHRAELPVGAHKVNFRLRVKGDLLVNPDREQLFVTISDLYRILAVVAQDWEPEQLAAAVAAAYASEQDTKALGGRIAAEVARHKKPSPVKGNVNGTVTFTRLS